MAVEQATPQQGPTDPEVSWLKDEIDTYERIFDKWLRRGRKILKKYRDVRSPREDAITRYNILWANVQTRLPALYARNPKPVVERRFKDRDPIGRTAAEVLERSIEWTLDHENDFFYTIRNAVRDYELPGRGTVWVRYEPEFHKEALPDSAAQEAGEDSKGDAKLETEGQSVTSAEEEGEEEQLRIKFERTLIDYINWEDFGHSWGRTFEEVRLIWKRAYMDREELTERFAEGRDAKLSKADVALIPLDWSPKNLTDTQIRITRKKAVVYEVLDKHTRRRYWLVKNFPRLLDRRDDALGLHGFWPLPRPLMANELSDELMPTPNYSFYQDQANEIDELSTRIVAISKALKVAGVRDTSAPGLDRLLSEGVENQLVPVDGWAALKEKGGLKGVMELLPLEEIAKCLEYLRDQRRELIEDVYQLTGISDIIRGFTDNPEETATAQQMKGKFSMLRIQDAQFEVQRFCRDVIRIVGEIVASYDVETLKAISGVKLLTNEEKGALQQQLALQQLQQQQQQQAQAAAAHPQAPPGAGPNGPNPAPQGQGAPPPAAHAGPPPVGPGGAGPIGQPPAPAQPGQMAAGAPGQAGTPASGQAPLSPDKLRLLEQPTWEEVAGLLENPVHREFKLDIETDSTISIDEDQEKQDRLELVEKVGEFLDKAITVGMQAPQIVPMLGEVLMFVLRAYKAARPIEQAFEDAMQALEQSASQPKGPPPEVQIEMMKGQAQVHIAQMKAQLDGQVAQAKQQAEAQQDAVRNQQEAQRDAHKIQLESQLEQHKANLQAQTQAHIEQIKGQFEMQKAQYEGDVKIRIAHMQHGAQVQTKQMELQHAAVEGDKSRQHEQHMGHAKLQSEQALGHAKLEHEAEQAKQSHKVESAEAEKDRKAAAAQAKSNKSE